VNTGAEAISSLVGFETELAVTSLADLPGDDGYDNGGVASAITDIDTLVSAGDVAQGLSGATYVNWNARGVDGRTAGASATFTPTTTSFATAGLANMRTCYLNASEGGIQPNVILTTYDIFNWYEGSLTASQQFTNTNAADGAFTNLSYKQRPILPDDKCPSGTMYMLRIGEDGIQFCVLNGADFMAKDFKYAQDQEARVSEVQLKGNLICHNRKYSNKLTGLTA